MKSRFRFSKAVNPVCLGMRILPMFRDYTGASKHPSLYNMVELYVEVKTNFCIDVVDSPPAAYSSPLANINSSWKRQRTQQPHEANGYYADRGNELEVD